MLIKNGEVLLQAYADTAYPYEVHQVNDRMLFITGLGHSNCTVIEGDTSLILIDTLDSDARAQRLKELLAKHTDKVVKTIIFTHGHPDHRGGSGAFADTAEEVIMSEMKGSALRYYEQINDVLGKRTKYQFGTSLSKEECISQGLGIREGYIVEDGKYNFLAPTTLLKDDIEERVIDGVPFTFVSAPGETNDQIFVWLPEDKVLCCGDNYYGCFPNLYALRGSQYRDIASWVDSLSAMLEYPSEILLPGHTKPIFGHKQIHEVLSNYRDAIAFILKETLYYMNQGCSMSETVEKVKLPAQYAQLSYLQEHYGCVEWAVKGIYNGYVGWFDGNPAHLHPLPDHIFNEKLVNLIGEDKLLEEIKTSFEKEEYTYVLQLCEMMKDKEALELVRNYKQEALLALAKQETSACGRNYYLSCAKEYGK